MHQNPIPSSDYTKRVFPLICSLLLGQVHLIDAVVPCRHQTVAFAVAVVDDNNNNWALACQDVTRNNERPINNKVIYITLLEWSFSSPHLVDSSQIILVAKLDMTRGFESRSHPNPFLTVGFGVSYRWLARSCFRATNWSSFQADSLGSPRHPVRRRSFPLVNSGSGDHHTLSLTWLDWLPGVWLLRIRGV